MIRITLERVHQNNIYFLGNALIKKDKGKSIYLFFYRDNSKYYWRKAQIKTSEFSNRESIWHLIVTCLSQSLSYPQSLQTSKFTRNKPQTSKEFATYARDILNEFNYRNYVWQVITNPKDKSLLLLGVNNMLVDSPESCTVFLNPTDSYLIARSLVRGELEEDY